MGQINQKQVVQDKTWEASRFDLGFLMKGIPNDKILFILIPTREAFIEKISVLRDNTVGQHMMLLAKSMLSTQIPVVYHKLP